MRKTLVFALALSLTANVACRNSGKTLDIQANTWIKLARDERGARRSSSFRYVGAGGYFLQWGYLGHVTEFYGNPETPYEGNPEYDLVYFDPAVGRWQNQFPFEKEKEWSAKLPPMHLCSSYQGITTGAQRPQLKEREGVLRPDLNIVFDQVTYDSRRSRMVYFTGGRTFAYDIEQRQWSDIAPQGGPPPVSGGSLCYDPFNDEIVLAGGGHVAEAGPNGRPVGFTGTWVYDCGAGNWRKLDAAVEPPPRMQSRLVCDSRDSVLVMFGGDGQSRYLSDTWVYDTRSRAWRVSAAPGGPPARAGHFTVYDPVSGWVIVGGGYSHSGLSDMWAYEPAADRWLKIDREAPTGWYVTADIEPERSLILLTTSDKPEGDNMGCNEIYPVRTTYAFRIESNSLETTAAPSGEQAEPLKRPLEQATAGADQDPQRSAARARELASLPENRWIRLSEPGRIAPLRTWGSCSFDSKRGRIVYWGGGHCGYGGNDYDFYDVAGNTWITSPQVADFPERAWDRGINPAGVTFSGAPWIRHGRKIYAYDPVSDKIINTKFIYLTAGYEPECLSGMQPRNPSFGSGENYTSSGYTKWPTWSYDPQSEKWDLLCSGEPGLDLTVTTPRGVMAVNYNWGKVDSRDSSDWVSFEGKQVKENAVYLLDVAGKAWKKISGGGPWPQNLYELTELVWDSRRSRLLLHGAGPSRDELWSFNPGNGSWLKLDPSVRNLPGGSPPVCLREAVYIPAADVMLTCGYPENDAKQAGVYVYRATENAWYKTSIPAPEGLEMQSLIQQNRSITFDPERNLALMVLGDRAGDDVRAVVYALRYNHGRALAK